MLLIVGMTRAHWQQISVLCATAVSLATAVADTVLLTNGRTLQGIVLADVPDRIEMTLGVGTVTIPRRSIAKVEIAPADENEKIESDWKQKYFAHNEYVPGGMEQIARLLTSVKQAREALRKATIARAVKNKQEKELVARLERTRTELIGVSKHLQSISGIPSPAAYNNLVRQYNSLSAKYTVCMNEIEQLRAKLPEPSGHIFAYLDSLHALRSAYRISSASPDARNNANCSRFLDAVSKAIEEYSLEIESVVVRSEKSENGIVVAVTVNDSTTGRFLLDTGAAVMTISERFARLLNLDTASLPQIDLVVADGSRTPAKAAILSSVAVGEARTEHVETAITPEQPTPNVDGLLGMSFLRNFAIRIDPSSGQLTLNRFSPR